MNIGQKLLELRKSKNLSQEAVSKWETDQSMPDFDKIKPLCELFEITPNELVTGKKEEKNTEEVVDNKELTKKRALGIGLGILLYFVAIAWIMISIEVMHVQDEIGAAGFMVLCGIGTFLIIYTYINI